MNSKNKLFSTKLAIALAALGMLSGSAQAGLIAYDQFTGYTDGPMGGKGEGIGWGGSWFSGNNGSSSVSTTISNSSGLSHGSLTTSGGATLLGSGANDDNIFFGRNLDKDIKTTGTYYFGFLLQQTGEGSASNAYLRIQSRNGNWAGAGVWNSESNWNLIKSSGGFTSTATTSITTDVTHFVIKLDFNTSGSDTASLYINPTDSAALAVAGTSTTLSLDDIYRVQGGLNSGADNRTMTLDEIRIGTEAADMFSAIPEPSALALIGLGGMALFLRRRRA